MRPRVKDPAILEFIRQMEVDLTVSVTEFDRMIRFLDLAWKRKDHIVPCLVGPVGIGKTAAVLQHAENVGAGDVVTIIASQVQPSEVSGITMPVNETKSMEIFDHYKLSNMKDGDILFLDELLEADQCVLSACLTLIESRQMMSGTKLPDIQIIAATNPTVNPANLKPNIRQRFMFSEFMIDAECVADYIERTVGFRPPKKSLDRLESDGQYFNILSPRSLTKLCEWIASGSDPEESLEIGKYIDKMFGYRIGTELAHEFVMKDNTPEMQARKAMLDAFTSNSTSLEMDSLIRAKREADSGISESIDDVITATFMESSMDDLMDLLKSMHEWDKVAETLSQTEVTEVSDDGIDF